METKPAGNRLLTFSALALIICAVLGVIAMWMLSGTVISPELLSDPELLAKAAISANVSPDELVAMLQTPEGTQVVGTAFMAIRMAMVAMAAVASLPRLIAGVLGLSRVAKPEKHGFFLVWGAVLLTLGIIGLVFTGGIASFNGLVSVIGGLVAPILYIIGAAQQKKLPLFPPLGGARLGD